MRLAGLDKTNSHANQVQKQVIQVVYCFDNFQMET